MQAMLFILGTCSCRAAMPAAALVSSTAGSKNPYTKQTQWLSDSQTSGHDIQQHQTKAYKLTTSRNGFNSAVTCLTVCSTVQLLRTYVMPLEHTCVPGSIFTCTSAGATFTGVTGGSTAAARLVTEPGAGDCKLLQRQDGHSNAKVRCFRLVHLFGSSAAEQAVQHGTQCSVDINKHSSTSKQPPDTHP